MTHTGGHYTAYVKSGEDWYMCNDSSAYKVDRSALVSAEAYVLFYIRRNFTELRRADGGAVAGAVGAGAAVVPVAAPAPPAPPG